MKVLDRLYARDRVTFAIVWIVAYVVLMSLTDSLSLDLGVQRCLTAPLVVAMVAILWAWVRHAGLEDRFGLRAPMVPAIRMLLYLPLVVFVAYKFVFGVTMNYSPLETALFVTSMVCVGFLEEVIFRGLLLRGMAETNMGAAIVVSSVTFGMGHVVNLLNASGQDLFETLVQMLFAVIIGFVLVFVLLRCGSLWPCILFHGAFNASSAFSDWAARTAAFGSELGEALFIIALAVVVGGGYLAYLLRMPPLED